MSTPEPDEFLLEAMREVDAMLPDSPPIAPRQLTAAEVAYYNGMQNALAPGRYIEVRELASQFKVFH